MELDLSCAPTKKENVDMIRAVLPNVCAWKQRSGDGVCPITHSSTRWTEYTGCEVSSSVMVKTPGSLHVLRVHANLKTHFSLGQGYYGNSGHAGL